MRYCFSFLAAGILALAADLHALHADTSGIDGFKSVDAAQERALAGPARSADHDDFRARYAQAHLLQDLVRAEPLVDAIDLDHGCFGHRHR